MLEHSAMYLNVTPPYEDEASFFPDFYTRLGPCELQDPVWAKMSALAGVNKKRKKAENKPQSQINKCNNEKRRREQENIYIEELAELISANFADMSSLSVKPDKCAILQETVNQIRRIKQQDNGDQQNTDPVQQGEVSSSRPTILSNEVYGPLLLEALEGFLFVVNSDGKVEHVTENVSTYIRYTKEEIIGKTIYNFMHPGDHTKFHSNLLPMTIEWGSDQPVPTRSKSIDVRLLVKDDLEDSLEDKRQRVACYELMHISSTQLRDHLSISEEDGSDSGPCLLCVASRISHRDKASCSFEQFTTKLDSNGKIICVDTSGVSDSIALALRKDFKNRVLRDLVPPQDDHKVTAHLKETLSAGTSISQVYRIQVAPDKFVQVQTKSKLFKTNPHASETDFIMATHSIISDNENVGPGDPGGGSGIGGPLMTSVVNGTGGPSPRNSSATTASSAGSDSSSTTSSAGGGLLGSSVPVSATSTINSASVFAPTYLDNDFSIDFPTTTWPDLDANWHEATRPDSRQSVTPVSTPTPRPPSNPSYSNAPTVVQSPVGGHYGAQQSPSQQISNQQQQQQQQSSNQTNSSYSPFMIEDYSERYSVDEPKDTKANVLEEAASLADSHRLRILLTNPSSASNSTSMNNSQQDKECHDRILKSLLNQQDEDHSGSLDNRASPRDLLGRAVTMAMPTEQPRASSSSVGNNNNMLRQLLNDKTDDDQKEAKAGMKRSSELLEHLLKQNPDADDDRTKALVGSDQLFKKLGFLNDSSNEQRGTKRSMDDKDERDGKRSNDGSQVSSSSSELCKRNRMLASLLAKQTPTPPSIPPVPQSVICAIPQEKLPRVTTDPAKTIGSTMAQGTMNNNRSVGRPARQPSNYLTSNSVQRQMPSSTYTPPVSASDNNSAWVDNANLLASATSVTDPVLSELLDEVIDIVPDSDYQSGLSEAWAIYTIQKSLMQCESAVKSPTSPNISLPAKPPAYPQSVNVTSQNNLGYQQPPSYLQAKYQRAMNARAAAGSQYTANASLAGQQLLLQQQRKQLLQQQQQQQQEQKQRLLQQQKKQQLLIPSNATAAEMNSIQNIDTLLNNTVAPNVSLQRSSSVPESQLSPNFNSQLQNSNSLAQQNQRGVSQQQQPYSPHAQMPSPLGQQSFQQQSNVNNYQQQNARLSPQSQFTAQLSPRQAYPQSNGTPNNNWAQQRITVQQNPMLNAQLTVSGFFFFARITSNHALPSFLQRAPQQQQQGTVSARHSPFAADQFPPPSSPNSGFSQTQYLQRLQRANSAPNTSTQLPGGLGSPRPYTGREHHPPPHYQTAVPQHPPNNSPINPLPPPHNHGVPMMYQQDSPYCYDQQQHPGLAYSPSEQQRGVRGPPPQPHMQPGVAAPNPTSEFVRQELRAVVGARTAQSQPNSVQRNPQQQLQMGQQSVDLEALGITFEMPSGASDSPKLWGAMGSDMGSMSPQQATSRTTMEEGRQGDPAKTSLLQQLLSEQSKQ
ncbi:nuclear receptor coactivator 2-like isoform X3 [Cylas formicarius]|uniref:nuclear receptor coactivator 2-like isoform X3 n=1 Tax=Cylas formicarius TaxID=197179 RepID=UPI002958A758|nr:nuclear receptor coactivator 2-like isoform X3 [Cylas formicarius]